MGYCFSRESLLMMVADGMGGHLRGEVAAQLSMQTAAAMFQQAAQPRLKDPAAFLDEAFRAGHRELASLPRTAWPARSAPTPPSWPASSRTTIAWWAHAGDSRLYVMRDGKLGPRTRDHSKVESAAQPRPDHAGADRRRTPSATRCSIASGRRSKPSIEVQAQFPLQVGRRRPAVQRRFLERRGRSGHGAGTAEEPLKEVVPRLVRQAVQNQGADADNTTALAMQWDCNIGDDDIPPCRRSACLKGGHHHHCDRRQPGRMPRQPTCRRRDRAPSLKSRTQSSVEPRGALGRQPLG